MTTTHLLLRYLHIAMGMIGLISGTASMSLRKGSALHRRAGNVFFVSMLLMAAAGAFMAWFITPVRGNVMGGMLTFYLVVTAWTTVWRPSRTTGAAEIGGAMIGALTAACGITWGFAAAATELHRLDGYPPALYLIFGGVALVATVFDVRMIARGGIAGVQRTTRHLWRMCVAMFMATSSFFLGQAARRFPAVVRESGLPALPVLLVVLALIYFLIRIRVLPWWRRTRSLRLTQEHA